ncbi:hypothetical protein N7461_000411 [Penicillium sp. DV-2018c]|nr:hypothetical protein N7461_000411 [Penicillium sp. DV-2018c]
MASSGNIATQLLTIRRYWPSMTSAQKHDVLMSASKTILGQRDIPGREREINWSTIHEVPDISILHALNICDFYKTVTPGSFVHFNIPIEFVIMMKEAAKAACKKGYLKYAFDLLLTAELTFEVSWHSIQGDRRTKSEEEVSVYYTQARIATLFGDFHKGREHAKTALDLYYYLRAREDPRFVTNYPSWLLWSARAEAVSGIREENIDNKRLAEWCYRKALKKRPGSVGSSSCELDFCRCLFEIGRWYEPVDRLKAFIQRRERILGPDDTADHLVGYALYLLGNAQLTEHGPIPATSEIEDALNYYRRSRACFRSYFGVTHCWFGAVSDKMGVQYTELAIREPQKAGEYFRHARHHFDKALAAFESHRNPVNFKAECARVLYHKSILMKEMRKEAEWEEILMRADDMQRDITGYPGWKFKGAPLAEIYDGIVNPLFR